MWLGRWLQIGPRDAESPLIEELLHLHDFVNLILLFVISAVGIIMIFIGSNKYINKNFIEAQVIEGVWTGFPVVFLTHIALPSLFLLYLLDERASSFASLKAIGHQWFWSYEITDYWNRGVSPEEWESYILRSDALIGGEARLLEADQRVVVPYGVRVRALVSSVDVLHSWTVPSLGVKRDAVPGHLNQAQFLAQRPGVFYGQCSEICGSQHRFMPIVVEVINLKDYLLILCE